MENIKNIEGVVLAAFAITYFYIPRNGEPRIQLQDSNTGKLYEATLAAYVDKETGHLYFNAVRHFTDPESQAWFPDSEVWPTELMSVEE